MSIYSNVTEQDLIILRKLAEQQKNQRALKIKKKRILKQIHYVKLAESLSPITENLDEVNESTQKLGEIVKESNTPRLAMEKTHNTPPIENEQTQPGVIYDTSLENTLSNMKNKIGFLSIEERNNGDITRKGFPVEKGVVINLKLIIIFMI